MDISRALFIARPAAPALLLAAGLAGAPALAQDRNELALRGSQLTAEAPGAPPFLLHVSSRGVARPVADIGRHYPVIALAFEGFLVDDTYEFAFGLAVQEVNTMRRLEFHLPRFVLEVAAGSVTASVPAGQATLLGREPDGSAEIERSYDTSELSLNEYGSRNGGLATLSLSFDTESIFRRYSQINAILSSGPGRYTYGVFMKQTAGVPLRIGTTSSSGVFTPLPAIRAACAEHPYSEAASQFQIDSSQLAETFENAHAIQGGWSFSGGGDPRSPEAFTDDCSRMAIADVPGTTQLFSDVIGGTASPAAADEIAVLVAGATDLGDAVERGLASGAVDVPGAIDFLEATNELLELAGASGASGPEQAAEAARVASNVIASIFSSGTTLEEDEVDMLTQAVAGMLGAVAGSLTASTTAEDARAAINGASDALNNAVAAGMPLDGDALAAAADMTERALQSALAAVGETVRSGLNAAYTTPEETQTLLSGNPQLLLTALDHLAVEIRGTGGLDVQAATDALEDAGLDAAAAGSLVRDLARFATPFTVRVENEAGDEIDLAAILAAALAAYGTVVPLIDDTRGIINLTLGSTYFPVLATRVWLVSESIPSGATFLADGGALLVAHGVGVIVVPASADPIGFAVRAAQDDTTVAFGPNGTVNMHLTDGSAISGSFGFAGVTGPVSGDVDWTLPAADTPVVDDAYRVGVTIGAETQTIHPYLANGPFIESATRLGFSIFMDRGAGLLIVDGALRVRPDLYILPLTGTDRTFLSAMRDATGNAYRGETDFNGDGIIDYDVIDDYGKQRVYLLP